MADSGQPSSSSSSSASGGPGTEAGKPRPFLVVLTGGPSSGKSSALALLRDRLSARGFQVLTVPENATHFLANSDGFQAEWAGTDSQVRMQRIFLDFQVEQEDAFKAFAELHPTKRAVLLLDCCTLNSKVYVSNEQWAKVLALPGKPTLQESGLFARYDLVVHMVTCALESHYEFGPGSNNPARYHTPEQAKEQDQRCLEVFGDHPQLRVVPHCSNFHDKIEKVAEFVNDALQIEGLTGRRRRRTCRISSAQDLEALLSQDSTSASLASCTFVDDALRHSARRRAKIPNQAWLEVLRLWQKRWAANEAGNEARALTEEAFCKPCLAQATDFLYERRSKVGVSPAGGAPPDSSENSYLARRVISEEDYFLALQSRTASSRAGSTPSVTKLVLRFLDGTQYYELLFFLGRKDLILDFSAEVTAAPRYLQLIGSRDLARQDSSCGSALHKASDEDGPVPKKPRILRAHSTEEAAFLGC